MDATTLAGIMGLVGALIGGYGSYLGGIKGAKKNSELLTKHQEKVAAQSLGKLLDFTVHNMEKIDANVYQELKGAETVLYDQEWTKYLAIVNISNDDRDDIITWLTHMQLLANRAQLRTVYSNDVTPDLLDKQNQELISSIAKKLLMKEP